MCVIRLSIYRLRREDLNFLLLLESFSTSLSTLSLYSYTLFSHYYYYYCCHRIESHRIKLLLCQRVNESHTTFFFIVYYLPSLPVLIYLSKNAVFVNYLKKARTLFIMILI